MRTIAFLAFLFFLALTVGIDTAWGHTILGEVACIASLINTVGFGLLALPSDTDHK